MVDGSYEYSVTALSLFGFESNPSDAVPIDVGDVVPPAPVVLSGEIVDDWDAALTWTVSDGAESYWLYRDAELIATSDHLQWMDEGLPNGSYLYTVVAVDEAGNRSSPSNEVELVVSVTPPTAPVLEVETAPDQAGALDLAWAPQDGPTAVVFEIYRATIPFFVILLATVLVITYWPALSLTLVGSGS